MPHVSDTATLLIACPDQPGLVAAVANFVAGNGGNITHADQHVDAEFAVFFQRVEFELAGFSIPRDDIATRFAPIAEQFGMSFQLKFSDEVARVAILVSKASHCLVDLLARGKNGELPARIELVLSNHADHADIASFYGVPYHHLPVGAANKGEQEARMLALLAHTRIDLVVLARYMQVLSAEFVAHYPRRIINIHHSFLPAFSGGRPYHQAYVRGVKIIGATAHYATADLDDGPIIEQDVARISHRETVDDLMAKGRDLERVVLARAIRYHLEHRVLVYGNKTVVFA
ncbi:MAG: formyltetrahydrofolate deformylase [Actinomycetia bacterium]|nr:formyltetrahydrofolate deformylase [Actinomycetes bacterium]